jgi:hypothetical protein
LHVAVLCESGMHALEKSLSVQQCVPGTFMQSDVATQVVSD